MTYEKFQEACKEDLESVSPTLSTQHDECAAQLFGDAAFDTNLDDSGILVELLETGSVTVRIGDKSWVVSLNAEEVKNDSHPT